MDSAVPKGSETGHDRVQQALRIDALTEAPPQRRRPDQKPRCGDTDGQTSPGGKRSLRSGVGVVHTAPYITPSVR